MLPSDSVHWRAIFSTRAGGMSLIPSNAREPFTYT
jgi:hypothetical protein